MDAEIVAIAQIIEPTAFKARDAFIAFSVDAGDDQQDAERWADRSYGPTIASAYERAIAVRALLKGE